MRVISAGEIDAALTFPALIDALGHAFAHPPVQPVRHHHPIATGGAADNMLLLMPAWNPLTGEEGGEAHLGVKVVTVAPANGALAMPSIMGTYLLMKASTGEVLAVMDGPRITTWRTAAASGLASQFLSRADSSVLALLGAGALAPFMARAHAAVRPIREIRVWNRSRGAAEALAASLTADGLAARAVDDPEEAVRGADIISSATLSTTPLIRAAWLKPGAHVDLVGAFTPAMRECDGETVRRAEVYVDTRAGALKEGGDLVQAIAEGCFSADAVRGELTELARGTAPLRSSADAITLFKSVGAALEDLAAASLIWARSQPKA